jgi:epoxyqueuosine reductase
MMFDSTPAASGSLTEQLKVTARALGFAEAKVVAACESDQFPRLQQWLEAGFGEGLDYIPRRLEAYKHPSGILPECRSLLMLSLPYPAGESREAKPGEGRVARYASGGVDYHDLLRGRLKQLVRLIRDQVPGAKARGVVDTAPLLERPWAQQAGLGWIGKNTLLLNRNLGSYFFLAAVLTDQALEPDQAWEKNHCGSCRACLDACPTDAFPQPYVLDARRCISYWTIEDRGVTPEEIRSDIGQWAFGCDICQEVCPWNRRVALPIDESLSPIEPAGLLELTELLELSPQAFTQKFGNRPLQRPGQAGLIRNALIVLGNQRHTPALPAIWRLLEHASHVVRCLAAWACGRIDPIASRPILQRRLSLEINPIVVAELESAISADV